MMLFFINFMTNYNRNCFRYLAMGCSFMALSFYFARGNNTISRIIPNTPKAICDCLHQEYMPVPNEAGWGSIMNCFYQLWKVLNCTGATDKKRIHIQKHLGSRRVLSSGI
jgi:hypothetical protein